MFTDETILTFGKHKFTKLCRVPAKYLLDTYRGWGNQPRTELFDYIQSNMESILARERGEIVAPELKIECDKIIFPNEKSAKYKITQLRNVEQDHKKPVRAYECEKCGGWHLTSISYEKWEKIKQKT